MKSGIGMNVTLRGKTRQILDNMITEGYASTKSEAIRLAILNFGERHGNEELMVGRKLDKIDGRVNAGKRKILKAKEALGVYAKHVER